MLPLLGDGNGHLPLVGTSTWRILNIPRATGEPVCLSFLFIQCFWPSPTNHPFLLGSFSLCLRVVFVLADRLSDEQQAGVFFFFFILLLLLILPVWWWFFFLFFSTFEYQSSNNVQHYSFESTNTMCQLLRYFVLFPP